eukprot:1151616-Pelagomonas_calceolata.AAC.6
MCTATLKANYDPPLMPPAIPSSCNGDQKSIASSNRARMDCAADHAQSAGVLSALSQANRFVSGSAKCAQSRPVSEWLCLSSLSRIHQPLNAGMTVCAVLFQHPADSDAP